MTHPTDPLDCSIAETARRMTAGETTAEAVTASSLARIAALDPALHAFVEVYAEEAMAAAKALDAERASGRVRGPLHGIPIAIKDLADISGKVTTFGSRVFSTAPAAATAPFVQRLIDAGMVVVGKLQMVEFALGSWGSNHVRGTPRNPSDAAVHRAPGGSSSGSGVAVAAGMVQVAIGSDTGGSIRIPSSLNGIVGLKTTIGLVPTARVAPLSPSFDTIGPMTRCVDDARLVFEALAAQPCPAAGKGVAGRSVGVVAAEQLAPVDAEVAAGIAAAAARIAAGGARLAPFTLPMDLPEYQRRNGEIMSFEGYASVGDLAEDRTLPIDPFVRERILAGRGTTRAVYDRAQADRAAAKQAFAAATAGLDFLILPSTPIPAPPLSEVDEAVMPMSRFTRLANYLDLCAVSLPAGRTKAGLPFGLQIVARGGAEADLLDFAAGVEALLR